MEVVSTSYQNKGKLKLVLGLTLTYLAAEVIGGILTKSLALLADAGHMLTDVGGLALALFAINITQRSVTEKRTYGYYRAEILAALANAVVLIFISLYILYEAWQRFKSPPEVSSRDMLIVAAIGLAVNITGMLILRKGSKESLNMKGAYFEVLSDMLTSIGVIAAAIIMMTTGWYYADPIISAGIGLFILPRTWVLLKDAVGVLLEGTPSNINLADVKATLNSIRGVISIHDLHVWSLTSGMNAMSVHVLVMENVSPKEVLTAINTKMRDEFKITHTTIQTEEEGFIEEQIKI
ncbi:cation diffusion facilitator family transporter [Hydrotalea lipotrueae]|jgi:cobalt-zinc-cadmium efflux system protein|uniref:cation diffusion facilitator family transporter n=1 Tax=Hydrotalea lipotrueae TaxID=2803817 RepID=UPI001C45AF93|nr:cation diffusion facilitator family transporter [Hydrotalea lipotrueae]